MELQGQLQYRYDENGQRKVKGIISGFGQGSRPIEYHSMMEFDKALEQYHVKQRPSRGLLYFLARPLPNTIRPFDWSTVPEFTRNTLHGYQKMSIEKIVSVYDGRALLAIEMGKGKTPIACVTSTHYSGMTLFVVKKSNLISTVDEYERWTGRDRPVVVDSRTKIGGTVTVSNYECAKENTWILQQKWSVIVFDESHTLMNPNAQVSQVLLPLAKTARAVILLSATPRKGCNSQIYNQLVPVVGTAVLGTYVEFTERYCSSTMKWRHGTMQRVMGTQRYKAELNILLQHCSIRLTSADTQLPVSLFRRKVDLELPKTEETAELQGLFQRYKAMTNQDMKDRMAQQLWQQTAVLKAPLVVERLFTWLEENPGKKVAVFFHHQTVLAVFKLALEAKAVPFAVIDAKTSVKNRNKTIKSLANPADLSLRVGMLSILTCSLGITLCPGVIAVFFAQLIHSPTDVEQCECKVYRMGAVEDVNSYWFVAKNSYDESMISTLTRKKKANGEVMDGEEKLLIFEDETLAEIRAALLKEGMTRSELVRVKISPYPNETLQAFIGRIAVPIHALVDVDYKNVRQVESNLVTQSVCIPENHRDRFTKPVVILKPRSTPLARYFQVQEPKRVHKC
jgi:SNF2 family DNA or RNA helicase